MIASLFLPLESGRKPVSAHWCETRDGDPAVVALFMRHYSCDNPAKKLRGGNYSRIKPGGGEGLILISPIGDALFSWHKSGDGMRLDKQEGIYCSVFRNEGPLRASELIREASAVALERWPGQRLFTFVDASKVQRSRTPGRCFLKAGWSYQRDAQGRKMVTKERGLLILERLAE